MALNTFRAYSFRAQSFLPLTLYVETVEPPVIRKQFVIPGSAISFTPAQLSIASTSSAVSSASVSIRKSTVVTVDAQNVKGGINYATQRIDDLIELDGDTISVSVEGENQSGGNIKFSSGKG